VLTTPGDIGDGAILALLGELLRPEFDPAATGALRVRMMGPAFSWQALVDLARGQGVLLPLTFALSAKKLLPPIPRSMAGLDHHVGVVLDRTYAQHLAWRQSDQRQLDEVLRLLGGIGTPPLLLKGARYLVDPLGAWCEARTMSDIDILLPPDHAKTAFSALLAEGYRQMVDDEFVYGPTHSHHLPALVHPDHALAVEIHTDALSVAGRRLLPTELVWSHASSPAADGRCLVLPPVWHALHGLLHHQVQDRGHIQRTLNLKALWEWTMLARAFTATDWETVGAFARQAGATDVLDSWLLQAERLLGSAPPLPRTSAPSATAHADATLRLAFQPYWLRRARSVADQLRTSFARETLAGKYDVAPTQVSLRHAVRNIADLLRRHRGNVLLRLTGNRDQLW